MRVPTANIVIGFNREVMDRLFAAGATYTDLVKEISKPGPGFDDTLLFDSQNNPNFISFEHTNNMGEGILMKLSLIDPKGEFEKRFVDDNVVTTIAGFAYNNDQNNNDEKDPLEQRVAEEMKASGQNFTHKFYADVAVLYAENKGLNQIYVAYGSGENLDLWAGPHRVCVTAAEISVKGAKKINLQLTPTPTALRMSRRRGGYNEKVNLDLAGVGTVRFTGMSKTIMFNNILSGSPAYDPLFYHNAPMIDDTESKKISRHIIYTLKKAGLFKVSELVGDFDFHSIVVDTLRSYIQKATNNPNVIVLLPNINIICRNLINTTATNTRASLASEGSTMETIVYKPMDFSRNLFLPRLEFNHNQTELGYKEKFLTNFLSELGLGVHTILRGGTPLPIDRKVTPTTPIGIWEDYEKSKSAKERFEDMYNDIQFYATLENADNTGIPAHEKAINSVINKILQNSLDNYQTDFVIFNETNIKVLDYWSNTLLKHYPTFGGYKTFNTTREAIIVGDQGLIREYLYAKKTRSDVEESAAKHQEKAALAQENMDNIGVATPTSGIAQAADQALLAKDNTLIEGIKAIPVHPIDSILFGEDYLNEMRHLIGPTTRQGTAGFGNISTAPDEFAHSASKSKDDDKNTLLPTEILARKNGISIFKYNTANPNILDMKFDHSSIYLAQLKLGFMKTVQRRASNVAHGVLSLEEGSLPISTLDGALAFLRNKNFAMNLGEKPREKIITELASRLSTELLEKIGDPDNIFAAKLVALVLDEIEQDNDLGGIIEIEQFNEGTPQAIMTNLVQEMYRKALQMTITTLPSFYLSDNWDINSPCIVFAQDAPISQTVTPTRTLMNSFLSGQYRVLGFSHKINNSKSESAFKLTKNVLTYAEPTNE